MGVQMDIKNQRTFLKPTFCEELRPELLFPGSTVTVLARQLKVLAYGNEHTRKQLEGSSLRCEG